MFSLVPGRPASLQTVGELGQQDQGIDEVVDVVEVAGQVRGLAAIDKCMRFEPLRRPAARRAGQAVTIQAVRKSLPSWKRRCGLSPASRCGPGWRTPMLGCIMRMVPG